jgi:hypothetical protein
MFINFKILITISQVSCLIKKQNWQSETKKQKGIRKMCSVNTFQKNYSNDLILKNELLNKFKNTLLKPEYSNPVQE